MSLPGGVKRDGVWRRDFSLRLLDGRAEIGLAEALTTNESWPHRLTRIMSYCVSSIGGEEVSFDHLLDLCVGDRHVIVRALILQLGSDLTWFTQDCSDCGEKFDFSLRYSDLPVKAAAKSFPEVSIKLPGRKGSWTFRVPTGRDQDALDGGIEESQVRREMINRLRVSGMEAEFTESEQEIIESAIEATMPELGFSGQIACPNCESIRTVSLDPYARLRAFQADSVFRDIDIIARHYHWTEGEILDLSRARRKRYIGMIESSIGASQPATRNLVA